jgi:hypothetical protein
MLPSERQEYVIEKPALEAQIPEQKLVAIGRLRAG